MRKMDEERKRGGKKKKGVRERKDGERRREIRLRCVTVHRELTRAIGFRYEKFPVSVLRYYLIIQLSSPETRIRCRKLILTFRKYLEKEQNIF